MRSRWTILAVVAATLWVVPQPAVAGEDVEAQIRQMNERMAQMEQQLQATNEELQASKQRVEQQQAVIQDLDQDREASSALSKFLSETEFSGLMAASYTYNFKNLSSSAVGRNFGTTSGENGGVAGITAPHHSNSNNFQVDQLAFRMKKTPTPESRAGWGASLTWGSSADALAGRYGGDSDTSATGDVPELTEAYAAYLFDIGSGVKLVGGRYMTPIGAESFFANENYNVTRGLLWTIQPVNHTGAYVGGDCECGISWQLGASNSYSNTMADSDTEPTFVGSVGYKMDTLGFKLNGLYGGNVDDLLGAFSTFGAVGADEFGGGFYDFNSGRERNNDKIGLLDAVLTWDPSDRLSTWVNFDYYWTANTGYSSQGNPVSDQDLSGLTIWGIAAAGRYAITEATGFSLRYEYLAFDNYGTPQNSYSDLMELTATLDHHLTDNLVVSAEARWDRGRSEDLPNYLFVDSIPGSAGDPPIDFGDFIAGGKSNHQVLGIVQLRYDF
jgi:hypothetical protein